MNRLPLSPEPSVVAFLVSLLSDLTTSFFSDLKQKMITVILVVRETRN